MPIYSISPHEFDFSRSVFLPDTGVLVAAFWPRDPRHADARTFLFEIPTSQLIIPISVVVETWGLLVGSSRIKSREAGVEFLRWLSDPGKVMLIPNPVGRAPQTWDLVRSLYVDCVDAILMDLADEITEQCKLKPPIIIITYDTRDFLVKADRHELRFGIVSPETPNDPIFVRP